MAFNRMGSHNILAVVFEKLRSGCIAFVDTNILLLIAQNLIKYDDLVTSTGNCLIVLIPPVLSELSRLAEQQTEKGRIASWVLENLVNRFTLINVEGLPKDADDAILSLSEALRGKVNVVVVTADIELKNKLIERGIPVIWYRKAKNGLEGVSIF